MEASTFFKVEVVADNSGKFCGNGLTFPDKTTAIRYAIDLWARWTLVREWRVLRVAANGKVRVVETKTRYDARGR